MCKDARLGMYYYAGIEGLKYMPCKQGHIQSKTTKAYTKAYISTDDSSIHQPNKGTYKFKRTRLDTMSQAEA